MNYTSYKPNFFLVGAPRCGTTALYTYLSEHPDVAMPIYDKEPHYFGSDLISPRFARFRGNEDKYLRLFKHGQNCKRIGEASVFYLYSTTAAQEIHEYNPEAKILIMVRNPADMLFSYYLKLHGNQHEPLPSFSEALEAEERRKKNLDLPVNMYLPKQVLFYREMASFASQIQRFYDAFGKEQVRVTVFDDFKNDTPKAYQEILAFLEVDSNFQTELKPMNSTSTFQSPFIRKMVQNRLLVKLGDWFYPIAAPLYAQIMKLNRVNVSRPKLEPQLRQELLDELRPEIDALSTLLDRDLSYWYSDY
ncbi:MAG: sulfotransferase family protein [Anaerolineae bacterium]